MPVSGGVLPGRTADSLTSASFGNVACVPGQSPLLPVQALPAQMTPVGLHCSRFKPGDTGVPSN